MKHYAKAITGAVAAGLTAIGTAMADGNITQAELVTGAGAALVAGALVLGVPNAPKQPQL